MLQRATQILLDAARMGSNIGEAKTRNKVHESLYRGTSSEKLASVAPYIFQFAWSTAFANWLLKEGWGKSWGILIKSSWPLPELHKHFRKFLKVETEEGRSLYFRFYDPRVLRIFLPTCDTAQLREFFGQAVDQFIMEDEDPAYAIRYWHENGFLKSDRLSVSELIAALPTPAPFPQEEDALPPETIAALKEQGLLEQVMQLRNESTATSSNNAKAEEMKPQPTPEKAHPSSPAPEKEDATPSESQPKTKWKMFD